MEEILNRLDLNEKETKFYLALLERKPLSASRIAKLMQESRTNTYMVLERLESAGLVSSDDVQAVRHYQVASPDKLLELLEGKENDIQSTRTSLNSVMQELKSLYILGQHKPGVTYLEGIEGYKKMLDGCANTSEEILIFASVDNFPGKDYYDVLLKGLAKRKARGITSRLLFHSAASKWPNLEKFAKRGQEVRFWGKEPFRGEIAIYEDKLILVVYEPSMVNVILTNSIIANTFKAIFNEIWSNAKKV